jgi:hypothetical protein
MEIQVPSHYQSNNQLRQPNVSTTDQSSHTKSPFALESMKAWTVNKEQFSEAAKSCRVLADEDCILQLLSNCYSLSTLPTPAYTCTKCRQTCALVMTLLISWENLKLPVNF